jgi:hypothetical protein
MFFKKRIEQLERNANYAGTFTIPCLRDDIVNEARNRREAAAVETRRVNAERLALEERIAGQLKDQAAKITALESLIYALAEELGYKRNIHTSGSVAPTKWISADMDFMKAIPAIIEPTGRVRPDYNQDQS